MFATPHVFGAPLGVTPLDFKQGHWRQKIRVHRLPEDVHCTVMRAAGLMHYSVYM